MKIKMRVAFRAVGPYWVAYIAKYETMEEAIEIGRILLRIAMENEEIRKDFMNIMKAVFEIAVKETMGAKVGRWNDPVPSHDAPTQ